MKYENVQYDKKGQAIFRYGAKIGVNSKSKGLFEDGIEVYDGEYQNLPKLNKHNSDLIESKINNDPGYSPNFMKIVFSFYAKNGTFVKSDESILAMMKIIDIVNGTQLFIKRRGHFDLLFERIMNLPNLLEDIKDGKVECVEKINSLRGIDELSFVSKFCKFMNRFMNNENDDAYFIYDYYVKEAVNFYLDLYSIDFKFYRTKRDYNSYFAALSRIQSASKNEFGEELTKDQIDHIIWYYFKSFSKGSAVNNSENE